MTEVHPLLPVDPTTTDTLDVSRQSTGAKMPENLPSNDAKSRVLINSHHVVETTGHARESPRHAHYMQNWWAETAATGLTLVAIVAIVVTLYLHEGKPLPQWPYSISINALISIYVTVMTAAIALVIAERLGQLKWTWFRRVRPLEDMTRFDSATRGQLGALQLLSRLRLHQHPLACLGALLTLVIMAIDPVAQLTIRYNDCNVPVAGLSATPPRTNLYIGDGVHTGVQEQSVSPEKQSAINAGILRRSTRSRQLA